VIAREDDAQSWASTVAGVAPYVSVKKREPLLLSATAAICPVAGIATEICACACVSVGGTMRAMRAMPTGWRNRPSSSPVSTTSLPSPRRSA
jgi:hypothetical protein